jgi:hypothetical protein
MGLYWGLFLKIGDIVFLDVGECYGCVSILEVAVDPSYSNFLETLQIRLIWHRQLKHIAAGCITILQAVRLMKPY